MEFKDFTGIGKRKYYPIRMPMELVDYLNAKYARFIIGGEQISKNNIILNWITWGIEAEKQAEKEDKGGGEETSK